MLTITLDHDADALTLDLDDPPGITGHTRTFPRLRDVAQVEALLIEILHPAQPHDVCLRRQADGEVSTIAEW